MRSDGAKCLRECELVSLRTKKTHRDKRGCRRSPEAGAAMDEKRSAALPESKEGEQLLNVRESGTNLVRVRDVNIVQTQAQVSAIVCGTEVRKRGLGIEQADDALGCAHRDDALR